MAYTVHGVSVRERRSFELAGQELEGQHLTCHSDFRLDFLGSWARRHFACPPFRLGQRISLGDSNRLSAPDPWICLLHVCTSRSEIAASTSPAPPSKISMLRPLGIFERALLISDQHAPFNVVTVLQLDPIPAPTIFEQALAMLQKRHPLMRARIGTNSRGQASFQTIPDPDVQITVTPRKADDQWIKVVEREMSEHFDVASGPLFRVIYLGGKREGEIILTLHHTIMDAASGMNLLDELLRACAAIQAGRPFDLPALNLVSPVEKQFPASFRSTRRIGPTLRYASSQIGDEIGYRWQARGKRIPRVHQGGRGHILTTILPEALVNQLVHRGRKERVTLNSLLNAALMLAVNRNLYAGQSTPMRTFSFADLRPYTVPATPSENLANYISMLRLTLNVSGRDDIWVLARELHAKIYGSLKGGDKFTATTMSEPLMKMLTTLRSMRMGATALNYSGAIPLQPTYGGTHVVGLHAFISAYDIGPEFASQARLFNDQLWWDFTYLDSDMDKVLAEKIIGEIRSILENAV